MDGGGSSVCRTWFDIRTTLPNSSSSAASQSSLNVGRSGGQYPWRRARSIQHASVTSEVQAYFVVPGRLMRDTKVYNARLMFPLN